LPEFGSWLGPIFGHLGVLNSTELGVECHICGASFRMLATHVWKTHDLWADEYRALFGLRARHGLVGQQTHDRLRASAIQYLVPHHESVLELLSTRTFEERSASAQGRQLRLETRLDASYQQGLRQRGQRQSVRLRVLMQDPAQAEKVRRRLRTRGPTRIPCAECGTPFLSPVQGAAARAALLCGDACRGDRKRRLRRERQATGRAEMIGKLAVVRRHHGAKGSGYERILLGLRSAGNAAFASLAPVERALVQRYYGLEGQPPVSLRQLTHEMELTRGEVERRLHSAVGAVLGVDYVGVPCQVCERLFVPPQMDHPRRTCSEKCARTLRQHTSPRDSLLSAARRQGRAAAAQLRTLDDSAFDVLSEVDRELVRRYYGLERELPATQAELSQRFGMSHWQVSNHLKLSAARLLDPAAPEPPDSAERRRTRALKIVEARRRQTGRAAAALQALAPQAFDSLPEVVRDLVRGFYGLGCDRPWSQRELAQRYTMPVARVARLVNNAMRQLLGDDTIPSIERVCAVCGSQFTVESRTMPRRACGPACHRELRRRAGQASAGRSPSCESTRAPELNQARTVQFLTGFV
jgi:hypothetical protein